MTMDSSNENPPLSSSDYENFSKNSQDLSSDPTPIVTQNNSFKTSTSEEEGVNLQAWVHYNEKKKTDLDIEDKKISLKHKKDLIVIATYIVIFFYAWFLFFIIIVFIYPERIDHKSSLTILISLGSIPTALLISIMRGVFKAADPIDQKNSDDMSTLSASTFVTIFTELLKQQKH